MCVGVSEALCAEVASGTNLYLDLKLERETWWQREKGAKLPQTGGRREGKLPQNVYNIECLAWQAQTGQFNY